jgi:ribonucrease Y
VIVSGFDPVRREVARQALDKLIADGRIHPSRIEEVVGETQKEIEKFIQRKGEEAAQEANIHGLHAARPLHAGTAPFPHELQPECAAAQH